MISAENISVTIGGTDILREINFQAFAGEVTAIVGPNGSGKTTLMKALTGDIPHAGRISLNGRDIVRCKPWELAAVRGVLPQASVLAFPFTVIEVVRMGLRAGSSGAQGHRAMAALARVGLAGHAGRHFQNLSGGEQQRVQLARVLAQVWEPLQDDTPRWLLLDEPVSSLDIAHQIEVMEIARDYAKGGGGVVAVMHDLNLTAIYADRLTILSAGEVLASGTPRDVMTGATLSKAYGCKLDVSRIPEPGVPFVLPHGASLHT
ncbi:heme ABC transporter ATP-binding protein [Sulfitobacter sp. LCG007]